MHKIKGVMMISNEKIVTRNEAASILRVDKSTVSRLAKSKEIACFRIGSRLLFKYEDIVAFINKRIEKGLGNSRRAH